MKIQPNSIPRIGRKIKLYNDIEYTLIGEFIEIDEIENKEVECWRGRYINKDGTISDKAEIPKFWLLNELKKKEAKFV